MKRWSTEIAKRRRHNVEISLPFGEQLPERKDKVEVKRAKRLFVVVEKSARVSLLSQFAPLGLKHKNNDNTIQRTII